MGRILRWGSLQFCQSLVNGLYPNRLVCLTIIINPLYTSINSPLQVYETYLTDNIIYYCAIGGWKAGSLNQKIYL